MTAVTGTINYSGSTTTTAEDVLTLSGWNNRRGGGIHHVKVTNRHASLILYVRTDATSPTTAAADGTVIVPPATTLEVGIETVGQAAGSGSTPGTCTVRVISSAAAPYNVVAFRG